MTAEPLSLPAPGTFDDSHNSGPGRDLHKDAANKTGHSKDYAGGKVLEAAATLTGKELGTSGSPVGLKDGDEALELLARLGYSVHDLGSLAATFDEGYYKRLTRKIDLTIMPILAFTYMLQFLDKNLLNYGAVMGIREDTHLHGTQYANVAAGFYYGFLAAEIPSAWLAQKSGKIATYLGVNIVLWGVVLGCTAAVNSFGPLFAVRLLLGVFEACVVPVIIGLISSFYPKYSQARRVSIFYCMNGFTEIVGGLIAYGLSGIDSNFATWRIMYVVFGGLTVIHGIATILFLPNSPVKARHFTDEEKLAIILSVRKNQSGTQSKQWKFSQALEVAKDPKILLVFVLVLLTSIPNGGISNFISILITGFGYTKRHSLLLQCGRGAVAFTTSLVVGWASDYLKDRSAMITYCCILPVVGGSLMVALDGPKGALLAAVFLTGTFGPAFQAILAWNASNVSGYTKRVTANALTMVMFGLGNITGSYTFPEAQAPDYPSGKITIMSCLAAAIVMSTVLKLTNIYYNRRNQRIVDAMDPAERERKEEEMAFADESDLKNPFFKYTY